MTQKSANLARLVTVINAQSLTFWWLRTADPTSAVVLRQHDIERISGQAMLTKTDIGIPGPPASIVPKTSLFVVDCPLTISDADLFLILLPIRPISLAFRSQPLLVIGVFLRRQSVPTMMLRPNTPLSCFSVSFLDSCSSFMRIWNSSAPGVVIDCDRPSTPRLWLPLRA